MNPSSLIVIVYFSSRCTRLSPPSFLRPSLLPFHQNSCSSSLLFSSPSALSLSAIAMPHAFRRSPTVAHRPPHSILNGGLGEGTYFGTGLGACGIVNNDSEFIVAVSQYLFDTYPGYKGGNPNNNPVCGRWIQAHYKGKSVTVKVTDRCVACSLLDLDFSPAAFSKLADQAIGRLYGVEWNWV
ncbi:RlpA-like double-psi beta-barrel-protein domain-containing protein-containing protein [Russula earlei]|uniref:RlpA-like double-psi beta-barrel-protein domain-containing protein-containing protein n=1 Tax=Russula earlei TaxID=71964 RepID=A0ACC0UAY8_9AGAM|nr:RlpA-like double-psi beta-barrel-protein domain-containing protein-containing protein [Russula earlei]